MELFREHSDMTEHIAGTCVNGKMVNGSRNCRALEIVSIESALYSALTIYIPMPDPSPSTMTVQTPTSYNSEEGVVAGHSGQFTPGGYLSTL